MWFAKHLIDIFQTSLFEYQWIPMSTKRAKVAVAITSRPLKKRLLVVGAMLAPLGNQLSSGLHLSGIRHDRRVRSMIFMGLKPNISAILKHDIHEKNMFNMAEKTHASWCVWLFLSISSGETMVEQLLCSGPYQLPLPDEPRRSNLLTADVEKQWGFYRFYPFGFNDLHTCWVFHIILYAFYPDLSCYPPRNE